MTVKLTAQGLLDELTQFEKDSGYLNPPLKTEENLAYYMEAVVDVYFTDGDEDISGPECEKLVRQMFELNSQN